MTKDKLIAHCEAYADALHDLAAKLQKAQLDNYNYQNRLSALDRIRKFFRA
jgi:hypothetical protein